MICAAEGCLARIIFAALSFLNNTFHVKHYLSLKFAIASNFELALYFDLSAQL